MMVTASEFVAAAQALGGWKRPLLISHEKPDGDALGSLAAMGLFFQGSGVKATALLFDAMPGRYAFVERLIAPAVWGRDVQAADLARYDSLVILDTCAFSQLAPLAEWIRGVTIPKLAVDHHVSRDVPVDVLLVDESAAATCLMLHDWAKAVGWEIDEKTAEALFIGLATDTGWFHHSNTDARALGAAAELARRGANAHRLYDELHLRDSAGRVRLLGAALRSLELLEGERVAVMTLAAGVFAQTGAMPADTEDMINEPLRIGSVGVSVLLVEQEGVVRVSLRSKPPRGAGEADVDVAAIAQALGGGGHRRAAGARMNGALGEVRARVIEAVVRGMG